MTAALCGLSLAVAVGVLREGPLGAILLLFGWFGLLYLFVRTWILATSRVRDRLVAREDLGDIYRMAALLSAFVVIGLAGVVLGAGLLAVIGALSRASGQ